MAVKKVKRPPSVRALAFKAWMKGRKTNTKRVAAKSGVPYSTLASFVQGGTQHLKGDNESLVANAYDVAVAEVFEGTGPRTTVIPIISSVAAGKLTDPNSQIEGEYQTIEFSGLPPGDYFATRVDGNSMDRISPSGSLILVNRAERDPLPGRRYVFARRGKTTYKRYENDPVLRLEPETTDPDTNRAIYPRSEDEYTIIGRVRLTLMDDL